ncbi:hypothetical protein ACOME3_009168 [Neoechinorhynchus agilis]
MKIKKGVMRPRMSAMMDLIEEGFALIQAKIFAQAIIVLKSALKLCAAELVTESYWTKYKIHWALSYCYYKEIDHLLCGRCMTKFERSKWGLSIYHCRLQLDCSRLHCRFHWHSIERLIFLYVKRGYLRVAIHLITRLMNITRSNFKKLKLKYRIGSLWQTMAIKHGQDGSCQKCRVSMRSQHISFDRTVLYGKAIEAFASILAESSQIEHEEHKILNLKGKALGSIGNCFYNNGDYVSAIFYYCERLTVSNLLDDLKSQCRTHYNLGNAYISLNKTEIACQYYTKAVEFSLLQERCPSNLISSAMYSCALASAHGIRQQYHLVVRWFRAAISYLSTSKAISGAELSLDFEKFAYDGLIGAYRELGDDATAERLSNLKVKSIVVDKSQKNDDDLSFLLNRMQAGCIQKVLMFS